MSAAGSAVERGPWATELIDLARAASGGLLFGIPLLYTTEVWWTGSHTDGAVEVVNDGDATAANVQVTAELMIGTRSYPGDQTIDFLGGGERAELAFSFDEDPAQGELDIRVSSYAVP